jgi:cysteine desulfuration protein SufE
MVVADGSAFEKAAMRPWGVWTGRFMRFTCQTNVKEPADMATQAFEDIAETFDFLDDWEDRYRHVIELGRAMPALDDSFKVPALKVDGCASQVWLRPVVGDGRFDFEGESDAMIVRGLIAILHALYAGLPVAEVARVDAAAELGRLGLNEHLSAQRSNGVRAMVERIRSVADAA